jgi:hypothetical protein
VEKKLIPFASWQFLIPTVLSPGVVSKDAPCSELKEPPMHSTSVAAKVGIFKSGVHRISFPAAFQLTWRSVGVGTLNSHSTEVESDDSTVPPPEVK